MIDSHAHLELTEFDSDREEVIARAREAGVEAIVTIGIDLEDCRKAVEIAGKYDMVYAAVGIHPHEVNAIDRQTYERMRELAAAPRSSLMEKSAWIFSGIVPPARTRSAGSGNSWNWRKT